MPKKSTAENRPFPASTEDIDSAWDDESVEVDLSELNEVVRPFMELRIMETMDSPGYGLESVKGEGHKNREDQGFVNRGAGVIACFDGCGGGCGRGFGGANRGFRIIAFGFGKTGVPGRRG